MTYKYLSRPRTKTSSPTFSAIRLLRYYVGRIAVY